MNSYDIRQALRDGRRVYATAMVAPSPLWPAALRQTGIDFVFIDSEHTPLGRESLGWLSQTFRGFGIPAVVRIPTPAAAEACQVLDAGAAGVIAPYVETTDQVLELMGACRLRPLKGQRLQHALRSPEVLEPELREYLERRNRETLLIANIESTPAIENLDDLLRPGAIDAVLIGPHDLSCSLGIPERYDHPRFVDAVARVFATARQHGCGAGIHWWRGVGEEVDWVQLGANLIMHSTDITLVIQQLTKDISALRHRFGDPLPNATTESASHSNKDHV